MNPTVPGYAIQREIGKGGMGIVYRASRLQDGMAVALKILPPNLITPTSSRRFQREGMALKSLDHPNIVRVYDVGSHEGQHFIAMEFVEGTPLSRLLKECEGPLPLPRALAIARQIGAALDAIHTRGMIHRDLKPANVLITAAGEAKLLDFGLVQVDGMTMLTAEGSVVGTPAYMSPEQCSGHDLDARSDIYAFGVLLYELFTGVPPFRSQSIYELLDLQKKGVPQPPRELARAIPSEIEQVILHCLEKDPATRPQSLRELLPRLGAAADAGRGTTPERVPWVAHALRSAFAPAVVSGLAMASIWLVSSGRLSALALGARDWLTSSRADTPSPAGRNDLRREVEKRYGEHNLARANALFQAARRLEQSGNWAGAWRFYRQAIDAHPTQPDYYRGLIGAAKNGAQRDEAARLLASYLASSTAADPDGDLARWLQAQERP